MYNFEDVQSAWSVYKINFKVYEISTKIVFLTIFFDHCYVLTVFTVIDKFVSRRTYKNLLGPQTEEN